MCLVCRAVTATSPKLLANNRPHPDDCWNVQWLMFVLGWFFYVPFIVGAFLPLCTNPRFPTSCHK